MISFKQKNKGFTLVEMLISVGIFTMMSALILANYPEFRSRSALDNLTAQVATVFREAQVYGISVREEGLANFSTGYGVHVDRSTDEKVLIIFADRNKNYIFDPDASRADGDTILESFRLNGGETITELCAPSCVGDTGTRPIDVQSITAVFVRPNPDAYFSVGGVYNPALSSISLKISNRSGSYDRDVEVYTTGQISVR
jgi:prepilin-type N-terminal cleavage/methylation domain-containing protein